MYKGWGEDKRTRGGEEGGDALAWTCTRDEEVGREGKYAGLMKCKRKKERGKFVCGVWSKGLRGRQCIEMKGSA